MHLADGTVTRPVVAVMTAHPDGIEHLATYRVYEVKPDGSHRYLETVGSNADNAERARARWESILNCTFTWSR